MRIGSIATAAIGSTCGQRRIATVSAASAIATPTTAAAMWVGSPRKSATRGSFQTSARTRIGAATIATARAIVRARRSGSTMPAAAAPVAASIPIISATDAFTVRAGPP
jgi:hypothetical protein